MKKVILSVVMSLFCIGSVFSQFDPQYTQYMLNPSAYNPAAVGMGDLIQVAGQYRQQWMGMDSLSQKQNTLDLSVNAPIKIGNSRHGIGVMLLKDNFGFSNSQVTSLQYAFKKQLGEGILSIGGNAGVVQVGVLASKVKTSINIGDYYDFAGDPVIPKADVTGTSLDLGAGAIYSTPKFYGGLSFSHLNNPVVNWNDKQEIKVRGSMYLMGGYTFVGADPKLAIKPTGLFKTDFASFQLDLSGRVEYDKKFWGGLSYRFQDAVSFLGGLTYNGVDFGFSYDLPTSRIINTSPGSLELLVMYNFAYVFEKRNTKYKSIRVL